METEPQDVSGPEDDVPEADEEVTEPKPEPIEPQTVEGAEDLPDDVKTDEIEESEG